jgi:hypothetical protein
VLRRSKGAGGCNGCFSSLIPRSRSARLGWCTTKTMGEHHRRPCLSHYALSYSETAEDGRPGSAGHPPRSRRASDHLWICRASSWTTGYLARYSYDPTKPCRSSNFRREAGPLFLSRGWTALCRCWDFVRLRFQYETVRRSPRIDEQAHWPCPRGLPMTSTTGKRNGMFYI